MCNDPIFLLFAGDYFYPNGGMNDFIGFYRSVREAKQDAMNTECDWWHVVDKDDLSTITEEGRGNRVNK